ncbi:MAG: DUF3305 domain-containing protein [Xanthobacteraceae bacterium]
MKPLKSFSVGVVVERTRAASQWIDYIWRPVTVLPGVPDTEPWTKLSDDGERATYYVGAADVELYPSDTTQYRDNLQSNSPLLWVALRPTGGEPPYSLLSVTADSAEGEALTETGVDLVDTVPMPDEIADMVARFVTEHHVERVFFKRKRQEADPEALAREPPLRKDRR